MLPVNIEPNEHSPKMLLNNGLYNRVKLLESLNRECGLFPNSSGLNDTLNEFTNTFGNALNHEVVGACRNKTGILYSLFRFHEIGDTTSSFMEMLKKLEETYKGTFIYPKFISKSEPLTLSRYFSLCNIYNCGETRRNGEPLDDNINISSSMNMNLSSFLPSLFYLSKTGNKYAKEVFENLGSYLEYIPVSSNSITGIGLCSKKISKGDIADIKDKLDEHLCVMDLYVGQVAREAVFFKRYGIDPSTLSKTSDKFTESYRSLIEKFAKNIGDPNIFSSSDSLFMPKITTRKATCTDFFDILGKMVERSGKEEALELLNALKFATNSDIYMSIILQDEDKWDCPDISMTSKRLNILDGISRSIPLFDSKYRITYKANEKRLYSASKILSLDDSILDRLPAQWIIGSLV